MSALVAGAALLAAPTLAPELGQLVGAMLANRSCAPCGRDVAAARQALPAFERACRPAPHAAIDAWLSAVALGLAKQPGEEEFGTRLATIERASGDLPGAVWGADTLAAALRRFRFLPGAAEVDELVRPLGIELQRQHDMLRMIAAAQPPEGGDGNNHAQQWARVRLALYREFGLAEWNAWLGKLTCRGPTDGGDVVLGAPSRFMADWIRNRWGDRIVALWQAENAAVRHVRIVVAAGPAAAEPAPESAP